MNPLINPIDRKNGFSLTELLVVILIIAVLVAILIPTVNRMRDRAHTTGCASNMRQCIAMSLMFAAEQNGRLPRLHVTNGRLPVEVGKTPLPLDERIVSNGGTSWWPDLITTYAEGASMVCCPELKKNAEKGPGGGSSTKVPLGIGINYPWMATDWPGRWDRLNSILEPGRMVWFTDAEGLAAGDWKDRKDQPGHGSCYFEGHRTDGMKVMPRHGGKINVGFADGHVALVSPTAINWGVTHTDQGKYIGYTKNK